MKSFVTFVLLVAVFAAEPAFAHHVMGGRTPSTFAEGLLSGLGHPLIGIDHFAAVVAVGCLAAAHRAGALLAVAFVAAMMAGVAVHLHGTTVPAAELLVAASVIVLGVILLRRPQLPLSAALGLFVLVGLTHGYALGELIYGAERSRSRPISSALRSFRAPLRLARCSSPARSRDARAILRPCA